MFFYAKGNGDRIETGCSFKPMFCVGHTWIFGRPHSGLYRLCRKYGGQVVHTHTHTYTHTHMLVRAVARAVERGCKNLDFFSFFNKNLKNPDFRLTVTAENCCVSV